MRLFFFLPAVCLPLGKLSAVSWILQSVLWPDSGRCFSYSQLGRYLAWKNTIKNNISPMELPVQFNEFFVPVAGECLWSSHTLSRHLISPVHCCSPLYTWSVVFAKWFYSPQITVPGLQQQGRALSPYLVACSTQISPLCCKGTN